MGGLLELSLLLKVWGGGARRGAGDDKSAKAKSLAQSHRANIRLSTQVHICTITKPDSTCLFGER